MPDNINNNIPDFQQPEIAATSQFRMYTPSDKTDSKLASHYDREMNEISSAPCTIYLLEDQDFDTLYGEDTDPIYSDPYDGVVGFFQPEPVDYELGKWGIEPAKIDLLIYFNKEEITQKLPRELCEGDYIIDCYNRLYEVTTTKNDANFKFDFITQYVMCKRAISDIPKLIGRNSRKSTEDKGVKLEPDALYND